MHRGIRTFALLLLVPLASLASAAPRPARAAALAPIVYLAPDGDDTHDCATPATRCASLQHGLDQLADGGEARLASGRYAGTTELNRPATIAGGYALPDFTPGDAPSILDGQRAGITLRVAGPAWARLIQLTITGGLADPAGDSTGRGGGIYIRGAQVFLDHVEVSGNIADLNGSGRGGGIYIRDGGLTLANSAVTSNTATLIADSPPAPKQRGSMAASYLAATLSGYGGGIYATNGRLIMRQSTIAANSAIENRAQAPIATHGWGGGLYAADSGLETQDTLFRNNDALATDGSGGAIKLLNSQARLRGGAIDGNRAGPADKGAGSGGGIDILGGATTLANLRLIGNSATNGSGVLLRPSSVISAATPLTLTNVLMAEHQGAALALLDNAGGRAQAQLRHTTLVANRIGVLADLGQSADIVNSLLVGNTLAAQALNGGTITIEHTNRYDNLLDSDGDIRTGPEGDLHLPPAFMSNDQQFRLAPNSPLLDRGILLANIPTDFEGQPRSADGNGDGVALPDLGWDELARSAAQFGPAPTLLAQPGQTLSARLDLRNNGLGGDTFQIGVAAPSGWSTSALPSQVTLAPRSQARLEIQFSVPANATLNTQATLTVQAVGQTSTAATQIVVVVGLP